MAWYEPPRPRRTDAQPWDGWLGFVGGLIVFYAVVVLVDVYAHGQVIAWPF